MIINLASSIMVELGTLVKYIQEGYRVWTEYVTNPRWESCWRWSNWETV